MDPHVVGMRAVARRTRSVRRGHGVAHGRGAVLGTGEGVLFAGGLPPRVVRMGCVARGDAIPPSWGLRSSCFWGALTSTGACSRPESTGQAVGGISSKRVLPSNQILRTRFTRSCSPRRTATACRTTLRSPARGPGRRKGCSIVSQAGRRPRPAHVSGRTGPWRRGAVVVPVAVVLVPIVLVPIVVPVPALVLHVGPRRRM